MRKLFICIFVLLSAAIQAQDEPQTTTYAPFSYWLKGKIGTTDIEIRINLAFDQIGKSCASVSGSYLYPSIMQPIPLKGDYCYKDKTLVLQTEGANPETFQFTQFDGTLGEGTWSKKDKKSSVSVQALASTNRLAFLQGVCDISNGEENFYKLKTAENQAIILTIVDDNNGASANINAYARAALVDLNMSIEYIDASIIYQILPNCPKPTLLKVIHTNAFTPEYNDEGDQIAYYDSKLEYTVFEYDGKKWTTQTGDLLLELTKLDDGAEKISNLVLSADRISATTYQNDQETRHIWAWNGKKFVKINKK